MKVNGIDLRETLWNPHYFPVGCTPHTLRPRLLQPTAGCSQFPNLYTCSSFFDIFSPSSL